MAIPEREEKTSEKSVKCPGTSECATALVAWFSVDGGRENTSEVLNEGV